MGGIEGLYIFDEHNNPILEHVYTGRPPSASVLLAAYLSHTSPRPAVIYLPNLNPPTVICSVTQDRLLFLSPVSSDVEPLLVLEFLHRVTDALDEFLGSPLLATKIDGSYDVVAQIVGEVCDAGLVSTTEPNALTEVVEAPSWMGNLFGGFGLPSTSPSLGGPGGMPGGGSSAFSLGGGSAVTSNGGSAIPWRRANVRHTSNELYVDIVERLSVILAPSGRPLSALALGNIIFTAKISGVPDLVLSLTTPGGKLGLQKAMDLPSFHPCVRLARWREKPGEISFVPPDGRFVLAGYECNLLPDLFDSDMGKIATPSLDLPISIETRAALGPYGDEFEVRLRLRPSLAAPVSAHSGSGAASALSRNMGSGRFGNAGVGLGLGGGTASSGGPSIEDIVVTIPVSSAVRNVEDLKAAKGEANFLASERVIEWRVSSKELATVTAAGTALKCTLTGSLQEEEQPPNGPLLETNTFDYDEKEASGGKTNGDQRPTAGRGVSSESATSHKKARSTAGLMPRSACLSFSMKGWLASGIKVDGLTVNAKTSKGLGAGVTPYKGVKYHTISDEGIEVRT